MKKVVVQKSNYDHVVWNRSIDTITNTVWQVICGDSGHWRCGIYSPEYSNINQIQQFEKHSCPEMFMLIEGELTLVIMKDNKTKLIELERNKPVMINDWHNGFCPNGPFTGKALVIEQDQFETEYRMIN